MSALNETALFWLREFARVVRNRDFAAGRSLFTETVVAYGTVCRRADDLHQLESSQWQVVWTVTEQFDFDYESARGQECGEYILVIAEWGSTGFDPEGKPIPRRGRSTILLQRLPEGARAVHTHFSMNPS